VVVCRVKQVFAFVLAIDAVQRTRRDLKPSERNFIAAGFTESVSSLAEALKRAVYRRKTHPPMFHPARVRISLRLVAGDISIDSGISFEFVDCERPTLVKA
jgi:hypothetical protein